MGLSDEIGAEQAVVDAAYQRLDELGLASAGLSSGVVSQGRGGLLSDRVDRDARVGLSLRRAELASVGDLPLCFGRLDTDTNERWYIGRMGVSDSDGEPLIVDWRAPLAEAFYRATSRDRRGVTLRRHIRMKRRQITGLDDEVLSDLDRSDRSRLVGEAALLAALSSPRTGRMTDIVATIQTDQDRAIRAPMRGPLVIQGGPGTGKTAVALHRAAFLLYAHRFPLASQGVLVVGPNPTFCRYVEQVLPGLGETGVRLATPAELVTGRSATVADAPEVAALKASEDMAERLASVIASQQRPLDQTVYIGAGMHRLAVTPPTSARLIDTARRADTYNRGRVLFESLILRHLGRCAARSAQRAVRTGVAGRFETLSASEVVDALRRSTEVADLVERLWPRLSPEEIVDQAMLEMGLERADGAWSEHDLALIDHAEELLGSQPARPRRRHVGDTGPDEALDRTLSDMGLEPACPRCGREVDLTEGRWRCQICQRSWPLARLVGSEAAQQIREIIERIHVTRRAPVSPAELTTFGHVIVDEAQDLSPMQWRMIARRCPTGSMTIVGDLGQSKHPWAPANWEQVCQTAAPGHPVRIVELTINYRTPSEVMNLACCVLAVHAPTLVPPRAVRSVGTEPQIINVFDPRELVAQAPQFAARELETVRPGKVAILRPTPTTTPRSARSRRSTQNDTLDDEIAELEIDQAKGLEFDAVIVLEPADFSPGELYVALTRTTDRLVLIHSDELPAILNSYAG